MKRSTIGAVVGLVILAGLFHTAEVEQAVAAPGYAFGISLANTVVPGSVVAIAAAVRNTGDEAIVFAPDYSNLSTVPSELGGSFPTAGFGSIEGDWQPVNFTFGPAFGIGFPAEIISFRNQFANVVLDPGNTFPFILGTFLAPTGEPLGSSFRADLINFEIWLTDSIRGGLGPMFATVQGQCIIDLHDFENRPTATFSLGTETSHSELVFFEAAVFNTETGEILSAPASYAKSVYIDIKPGDALNSINVRSQEVVPVAILSDRSFPKCLFDATTIDPISVRFGPDGATEGHGRGHIEDVNGDGLPDLLLHFNTQDTGIRCREISASLAGETFRGQAIEGSDTIRTVGCK